MAAQEDTPDNIYTVRQDEKTELNAKFLRQVPVLSRMHPLPQKDVESTTSYKQISNYVVWQIKYNDEVYLCSW